MIEPQLVDALELRSPDGMRVLELVDQLALTADLRIVPAFLALLWPCFEHRVQRLGLRLHKPEYRPVNFSIEGSIRDAALDRLARLVADYPVGRLQEFGASIRHCGSHHWAALYGRAGWKWWIAPPELQSGSVLPPSVVELCVLSSHANGYVRERAVALLAASREALAVRFVILRSTDWVPQVAEHAANAANDRPYAASSFLSVALRRVFSSALAGRCEHRPELAETAIPLGYTLDATPIAEGAYQDVTLRAVTTLGQMLSHIYVLIPVLDDQKQSMIPRRARRRMPFPPRPLSSIA